MAQTLKHSAKAFIVSADNPQLVLLVKEKLSNGNIVHDLPGGKIEPGESHHETIGRELMEELQIEVEIGQHLGTYSFTMSHKPRQVVCETYLCTFDPAKTIDWTKNPAPNEEIIGVVWLPIQKILAQPPAGMGPSLIALFNQYHKDYEASMKK